MKAWTAVICLLVLGVSYAGADTWLSYNYPRDYDYDYLRSDRTSREHRDAGDVDDWIERGNATVTSSPLPGLEDGIRLSAWASGTGEDSDYDFALASAIYFFEVPEYTEYAEIKIRYSGDSGQADFEDYEAIAGRVWVRNIRRERENRSYGDDADSETLHGDTFVLRARRRSETIKIPTVDHVKDGYMEVHLVVDGGGMLDVEYLDISTYRRQPEVRVIHRYIRDYDWRPWYDYSYSYFYAGPSYYATDYDYYIVWECPLTHPRYLGIRRNFHSYLMGYRRAHPHHYMYRPSYNHVDVDVDVYVQGQRPGRQRSARHLVKWTDTHQKTRDIYVQTKGNQVSRTRGSATTPEVRARVRTTIQSQREKPVLAERTIRERTARTSITFDRQRTMNSRIERDAENSRNVERSSSVERSSTVKRRTHTARPDEPEQRVRLAPPGSTRRSESPARSSVTTERSQPSSSAQQRREELERRIQQRKTTEKQTRTDVSSSSTRTQVKQRQSSNKDDDDDDDEEKEAQRQRNVERTKRRK